MATTLKSIDKRIATFTTNRDKLRNDAHEIAMLILNHAAPVTAGPNAQGTGDCTRMLRLCEAMPNSWAEQMVAWAKKFSPIVVVVKNGKCEYSKEYKKLETPEQKSDSWNLEGAAATPFYEATAEPDAKPILDFAALCKMVEGLSKRIAKKVEDGEVKPEDMESAKLIAERIAHVKLTRAPAANSNEGAGTKSKKTA